MIDPRIKKAIILLVFMFVGLPIASNLWGRWMDGTQQEMIDNQKRMGAHARGLTQQANMAQIQMAIRDTCDAVLKSGVCDSLRTVSATRGCVNALMVRKCQLLPDIDLCTYVSRVKDCSDPFQDPEENGCANLRTYTQCRS